MSRGFSECLGENGDGRVFTDDTDSGFYVRSPNITRAGVVGTYTEADWVRAIRHGLKPDGRPLFVMPSEDYTRYTDRAYLAQLPPRPGGVASRSICGRR